MQISLPLRSGYLDTKYAQCAETKDELKKSYRVFELWGTKRADMGAQTFAGKIGFELTIIFHTNDFLLCD